MLPSDESIYEMSKWTLMMYYHSLEHTRKWAFMKIESKRFYFSNFVFTTQYLDLVIPFTRKQDTSNNKNSVNGNTEYVSCLSDFRKVTFRNTYQPFKHCARTRFLLCNVLLRIWISRYLNLPVQMIWLIIIGNNCYCFEIMYVYLNDLLHLLC